MTIVDGDIKTPMGVVGFRLSFFLLLRDVENTPEVENSAP